MMILLDTNIVSELMKAVPSENIINWLNQQSSENLFVSTVTLAEISYGINVLPKGKRKQILQLAFNEAIDESFSHRILSFDERAAPIYGTIMSHRKSKGQPLSVLDGQIAAIAIANKKILATRNTRDFVNCGLKLVNPF